MWKTQEKVFFKGLVRFEELLNQTTFPVILDTLYAVYNQTTLMYFEVKFYIAKLGFS